MDRLNMSCKVLIPTTLICISCNFITFKFANYGYVGRIILSKHYKILFTIFNIVV